MAMKGLCTILENLYIYIENNKIDDILKYGIKLSEFSNKSIKINNSFKVGINAYLTPKDSELFYDTNYTCLRIRTNNLNYYIYNKTLENTNLISDFFITGDNYNLGDFEEPLALICSTILPENIFTYNKLKDIPILIENSKNYYYEKSIYDMLETGNFSNYELYQILLILGNQKKIFEKTDIESNIKIYKDNKSNKIYTKKNSI